MKTNNKEKLRRWLDSGSSPLDTELRNTLPALNDTDDDPDIELFGDIDEQEDEHTEPLTLRFGREKAYRAYSALYRAIAVIASCVMIGGLILICLSFPEGATDPSVSEVAKFYNEETLEHTGAVNVVCGIILNLRGFDTLGESFVLFLALNTVMLLLMGISPREDDPREELPGPQDVVPRTITLILVPLLLVFGIYIIFNGHLSPGGGFSGGAIIGAALILLASTMGFEKAGRVISMKTFKVLTTCALSFYALSKLYHFLTEAHGWTNIFSNGTPGRLFSAGLLLPLDICVGVVVSCTMYGMYCLFRRGKI